MQLHVAAIFDIKNIMIFFKDMLESIEASSQ